MLTQTWNPTKQAGRTFVYEGKGVPKQNPVFTPGWQTDFCAAPSPTGPFPCATIHPADDLHVLSKCLFSQRIQ